MTTVIEFKKRFPEFFDVDDERIQMFLDDAALRMSSPAKWLDFYDVAHSYLGAHFLAVAENSSSGDSGALAPISHQEVDDVIIKQAVSSVAPSFDELHSTSYGKRYANYRRTALAGPRGT